MKLLALDTDKKSRLLNPLSGRDKVGRIPESQIRGLDRTPVEEYRSPLESVVRRTRSFQSSGTAPVIPREQSDGLEELIRQSAAVASSLESDATSDHSSVVSCGETMTEEDSDGHEDSAKYRLPDHINGSHKVSRAHSRSQSIDVSNDSMASMAPPVPAKDTPPVTNNSSAQHTPSVSRDFGDNGGESYFNPFGLQRSASIYTLSRVSFSAQLSQLTSLQLPQASSFSTSISSIPTSPAAARALTSAADQIRRWIQTAGSVLSGLDADDDVEWAAAGGRDGLKEVDQSVNLFEGLIGVYVGAIEDLQLRDDVSAVPKDELKGVVMQMEKILTEWSGIKDLLRGVKLQVELAMEWEELWNSVLGDIGMEAEALSTLVFEMEERRHKSLAEEGDGLDIGELETIVEERESAGGFFGNHRMSVQMFPTAAPTSPGTPRIAPDDSSLLQLFARMQPLRASLDFLPMRLSSFLGRAETIFPTSCEELQSRRKQLEKKWGKLETDAEALRRELGEDRWVMVFRNAGRQSQKMCESVARSLSKLKESVGENGSPQPHPGTLLAGSLGKKVESYEAKKTHYGPAIERVLGIIEKGIKDRLTVNGEILRLHLDMSEQWKTLQEEMKDMDQTLETLNLHLTSQQLRDSISSIVSLDRSAAGGSVVDTPGSSPASSVAGNNPLTPLPKTRTGSDGSAGRTGGRRYASTPTGLGASSTNIPQRKLPASRLGSGSHYGANYSPRVASPVNSRQSSGSSLGHRPRPGALDPSKPRWNSSTNTRDTMIGHNFTPLSSTTPSPHARSPARSISESKIPLPSPLGRSVGSRIGAVSPAMRLTQQNLAIGGTTPRGSLDVPRPRLKGQTSLGSLSTESGNRRRTIQPQSNSNLLSVGGDPESPSVRGKTPLRPASAMAGPGASGRRTSNMSYRTPSGPSGRDSRAGAASRVGNGRESPFANAAAIAAMGGRKSGRETKDDGRPKWR
jgi:Yeast cortical protein KAR9